MANFVFYEGPSCLDGQRIVAIATFNSDNTKTGAGLVQTWIMRADIAPIVAARNGADRSICGDCVHRGRHDASGNRLAGSRTCYVQLQNAPTSVYGAYRRGRYTVLTAEEASERLAGYKVRLGSYGDPAAVPYHVWKRILARVVGKTGYTHQWRGFPELAQWCMASVDSVDEACQARLLGFRTFRVASVAAWSRDATEQLCGASHEAGRKVTCDRCMACGGTSSKARCNIVIPAHGAAKRWVVG